MQPEEQKPKKEFTAVDRAKAIDIDDVDMYVFNNNHRITGKLVSSERFMVIRTKNGRKYIFRETIEIKRKNILT